MTRCFASSDAQLTGLGGGCGGGDGGSSLDRFNRGTGASKCITQISGSDNGAENPVELRVSSSVDTIAIFQNREGLSWKLTVL
jgi:hypothetical protein